MRAAEVGIDGCSGAASPHRLPRSKGVWLVGLLLASCASTSSDAARRNAGDAHAEAQAARARDDFQAAGTALAAAAEGVGCGERVCLQIKADLLTTAAEDFMRAGDSGRARALADASVGVASGLDDPWEVQALIVSAQISESTGNDRAAQAALDAAQRLALQILHADAGP